jgi:hypothetical protein
MLALIGIFFIVYSWASGLMDWVVFLATSLVQGGVWITRLALVPVFRLWLGLKTSNTESVGPAPLQTHLNSQLRI